MKNLLKQIDEKKQLLEQLPALNEEVQKRLNDWLKVELIFSSNAIAGNTLSRTETAEIIEKGGDAIVPNRPLKDLIEVQNHCKALDAVIQVSNEKTNHKHISEGDILAIHKFILTGINSEWAGRYRESEVLVAGTDINFTASHTVPYRMDEFLQQLHTSKGVHPIQESADAHFELVSIHPFVDGNGRTARLLMNLILLINGYPLTAIAKREHTTYLDAVKTAQTQDNRHLLYELVVKAVMRSLDKYLAVAEGKPVFKKRSRKKADLLKIGELAKQTNETIHTIRYWTKLGLLRIVAHTNGGYQLYSDDAIRTVKKIRKLQKTKRLTLEEIETKIHSDKSRAKV